MTAGLTDYGADYWLGVLFGLNAVPTSYYLALCSDAPDEGWDGTQLASIEPNDPVVSGKGYARAQVLADSSHWTAGGRFATTAADVTFLFGNTDWGLMTHFALCDAVTGGNVYAWGQFTTPTYLYSSTYRTSFLSGSLVISLDGPANGVG